MTKAPACLADERKELAPEKACIIIPGDKKQEYGMVDVRSPGEHGQRRLPEAKSIPLNELD